MKSLFVLLLVSVALGSLSSARAPNPTAVDLAISKLSAFQPSDLKGEQERIDKKLPMKIDEMYTELKNANTLATSATIPEELAFQMERVALITCINNPMGDGIAQILPAYIKHTAVFIAAAAGLDEREEILLLENLRARKKVRETGDF